VDRVKTPTKKKKKKKKKKKGGTMALFRTNAYTLEPFKELGVNSHKEL